MLRGGFIFQFPLLAQGDSPLEDDFLLSEREYIWGYEYDPISPDGRFLIRVEPENFRYTEIVDLETGDINRITKANDKYYDVDYRWIPDTNYLSIVQRDAHPVVGREDRLIRENKLIAHRIIIYDVIKRSIVTYFNNVNNLEWSPDYTQILYDSGGRKFYQDDYHFGGTLCIFNILTGETECLTYIRNHHGSQLLQDFTWSPDETKISYTYAGFTSDPYFEPGGLCIAVLKTRSISCPTDPIFELGVIDSRSLYVISHSWAPNSKHLALTAVYCMPCDNTQVWKRLVIVSADGSYYHDLGLTYETSGLFPGLWRPPITD